MKHVIIAGAARTGKTTLSLMLRENNINFTHYKMDSIKRGMDNNFYEGRITLWKDASPKFAKLIKRIIDESKTDIIVDKEQYLIDTCHLYPIDIYNENIDDTIVIFLGYTNITPEEKLKVIRNSDPINGWTKTKDDETLIKGSIMDIEYSIEAKKQCEELNIPFFDTSTSFKETLNEAYKYIIERL